VPVYAAIFMLVMLSSIGLPGLNGFVGEFLIMLGGFIRLRLAVVIAVVGVILEALYMMWTYERVMFGPIVNAINDKLADLTAREIGVMVPVIALMFFMGLYPRPLISRMEPSVNLMLARIHIAQARIDRKSDRHRLATTDRPARTTDHASEIAAAAR
jgi:NADH-quinone oxidoreductase subunit M